jgi:competence protein ComEC
MATVALLALSTGRGADALGALALAAAAMLLVDPRLVYDLGFQLSALATLGLITLQPRVAGLLSRLPNALREPTSTTIAAQLATLPLLAGTFHQVSVVAPISNLLAAPVIPLITIAGAIGIAIVALAPVLTGAVAVVLAIPLTYLLQVIERTAALPGAVAPVGEVHPAASLLFGGALLAWAAAATPEGADWMKRLRSSRFLRPLTAGAGVLCAAGVAASTGLGSAAPPLVVSVLDVGQGDGVFVRTPSGRTILIDGGPNPTSLLPQLGRRMGVIEHNLSVAILTAPEGDAVPGAVGAAERYTPALMVSPPERSPSALYQRWEALAAGVERLTLQTGTSIQLEPTVSIDLIPTDPLPGLTATGTPQRTIVARIVYGEIAVLVAPAVTADAARALARAGWELRSDALVVPRHGARDGIDPPLVEALRPRLAVIPVGAGNRQNLPARETLEALRDVETYRTDLNGSVELRTDGKAIWAAPERT